MKNLRKLIGLLVTIVIISTGLYKPLWKLFSWLILSNYTPSSLSLPGDIFVRLATFAVTFAIVGALFSEIGWFDKGAMKVTYFVLSTLVSLGLSWIVMVFETHIQIILLIIMILLLATGLYWGLKWYNHKELTKHP